MFTGCPSKFQLHIGSSSRSLQRGKEKKEKGGRGGSAVGSPDGAPAPRTGFPTLSPLLLHPHPHRPSGIPAPQRPGTMPRPGPAPPAARHSPPRSEPRCRRLPRRRRPPWPWRLPPLTGPEAPAAAPASLRASWSRCSAPTAPLAGLLAAPPPAPHRRDPG